MLKCGYILQANALCTLIYNLDYDLMSQSSWLVVFENWEMFLEHFTTLSISQSSR